MSEHNLFKIHRLDQKTLVWWRSRKSRIDMKPSYQRKGRRWSKSDKQYLVDSILNGFDVPKFYMADFVLGPSKLNEHESSYAVIDGKQRLEAIFEFFDDEFPLSPSFVLLSDRTLPLAGKKYSELKQYFPDVAEEFDNFSPDVVGVISDQVKYIEELFVRLNRGKPLSGAELRNAFSTRTSEIIRKIGNHLFLTQCVRFNTGKGQDLNLAAKILMFQVFGIQETKKSSLDKFVASVDTSKEIEAAVHVVFETLELMSETFQFKDTLLASEGPIPVYYLLTRNAQEAEIPFVRDFLEEFQESMKAATAPRGKLQLISAQDWTKYKAASRSVNDKASHELRYSILRKGFDTWMKNRV